MDVDRLRLARKLFPPLFFRFRWRRFSALRDWIGRSLIFLASVNERWTERSSKRRREMGSIAADQERR